MGQGYDTHQRVQGRVDEAYQERWRPRASQTTRGAARATFLCWRAPVWTASEARRPHGPHRRWRADSSGSS